MRARLLACLTVVTVAAVALPAAARDFRVQDIPNGAHFMCLNCHTDDTGKSFTPFGSDAKSHLVVNGGAVSTEHVIWDKAYCQRDSDGDGITNGQELGDPDCAWVAGDANPPGAVTNPGVAGDGSACGNGAIDPGEDCDGDITKAFSCSELSMGMGLLGCTPDCAYDTSKCSGGSPPLMTSSGGDASGGCSTSSGTDASALTLVALALVVASRRRR
jgi:MYXO-CTERM domain-containing protein